jgi:hypothetical protein
MRIIALISAVAAAPFFVTVPDDIITKTCKTSGPVQVCALNKNLKDSRLEVTYTGYLASGKANSTISAWTQVNDKPALTIGPFQPVGDGKFRYTINALRDVQVCYQATFKDDPKFTIDPLPRCPVTDLFPLLPGEKTGGNVVWFYNPSPNGEFQFIELAGVGDWNIQLAFVNAGNQWDSIFGKNYRLTL